MGLLPGGRTLHPRSGLQTWASCREGGRFIRAQVYKHSPWSATPLFVLLLELSCVLTIASLGSNQDFEDSLATQHVSFRRLFFRLSPVVDLPTRIRVVLSARVSLHLLLHACDPILYVSAVEGVGRKSQVVFCMLDCRQRLIVSFVYQRQVEIDRGGVGRNLVGLLQIKRRAVQVLLLNRRLGRAEVSLH